ncbi:Alpha-catulin [Varanus komodoensis]|nr:Alpha-catulin [Varanus komodoensis]
MEKWEDPENEIVRHGQGLSSMAYSMYLFTRGEGLLKTTQDFFQQAETGFTSSLSSSRECPASLSPALPSTKASEVPVEGERIPDGKIWSMPYQKYPSMET